MIMRMTMEGWRKSLGGAISWKMFDLMIDPDKGHLSRLSKEWQEMAAEFQTNWQYLSKEEKLEFISTHPQKNDKLYVDFLKTL
jgi:hypothetical protein